MKAQMSVEYITTYSWALVVVAIIIGTLVYYGAFTEDTTVVENSCDLGPQFDCEEYIIDQTGHLSVKLRNGINDNINLAEVVAENGQVTCTSGPTIIPPGEEGYIYCDLNKLVYEGDVESTDLVINFRTESATSTFKSKGVVASKVSGLSAQVPEAVCDLDIDGYDNTFCGGNDCNDGNSLVGPPVCNNDADCVSQYGSSYICENEGTCASFCKVKPAKPPSRQCPPNCDYQS